VAGADADRDAAVAAACDGDADAICAITSIVAQRHRFAAVDTLASTASAPVVDLTPFFTRLEAAMTGLAGLPCRITSVDDAAPDLATTENVAWYTAPDGGWLGIALSTTLAEALVNQRCGGELAGDDGRLSGTASVLRLQAELNAVIRRVAAANWLPVEGEWASATTATAPPLPVALPTAQPPLRAMTISVGDLRCRLGIAVALAPPVASAALPVAWAQELRRSLDYYRGRSQDAQIHEILLVGGTARLKNLAPFLEQELGIPTRIADPLQNVQVTSKNYTREHLEEVASLFPISIGLGARELIFVPAAAKKKKK